MKKNDFGYPNGKKQVCLMIAREDTAGRRATWSEYQPTDADALSLCVAVEVKGSVYMPFESFKSGTVMRRGAMRLPLRSSCGKPRRTGATSSCTSRRTRATRTPKKLSASIRSSRRLQS